MKKPILIIITLFLLTGCSEINITNPKDSYRYWSGSNPPEEIKVINGQYWQSAHWTREYIMYLKLQPKKLWWNEYINQNQLQIDSKKWNIPTDAPTWFNPPENSIRFNNGEDLDQGSRYFQDTITGDCYIYEIQL